jgi:hypothetical protein
VKNKDPVPLGTKDAGEGARATQTEQNGNGEREI